eukprot:6155765-Prymnesium_polylepis.1
MRPTRRPLCAGYRRVQVGDERARHGYACCDSDLFFTRARFCTYRVHRRVFRHFDSDDSGFVDLDEFCAVVYGRVGYGRMSDGLSNAISIGGAPAASSPGDGGSGQRGGGGDVGGGVESGGSGGS